MGALSGEVANPGQYGKDIRKGVSRGKRTTSSSTTTTTEIGVLRLDGVKVYAGHQYRITTSALSCDTTVSGDLVRVHIRYTTDGTTAGITSTDLGFDQIRLADAANSEGVVLNLSYIPTADEVLSVLLTVHRASGTGSVSILGATDFPIDLFVDDKGLDPGNTGVSL
jgi:hypothetical protein